LGVDPIEVEIGLGKTGKVVILSEVLLFLFLLLLFLLLLLLVVVFTSPYNDCGGVIDIVPKFKGIG
jgi:hypothetical protein